MSVAVAVPSVGGRRKGVATMKRTLAIIGVLLGVFLIARAMAWPFTVDPSDPGTYAGDWGGPSLLGAAAVHCGPGILSAAILIGLVVRGRLAARRDQRAGGRP
jgi:hypothetical protein